MKILDSAALRLRAAGIESPRLEARLLLAHAGGASQTDIVAGRTLADADADALTRFNRLVDRRIAHEPLAYILGRREFWSLDFQVGPGVLIPRPESETLVEAALRRCPERDENLKVLDLGTGSGCLLLAFLSERKNAKGLGVDVSDEALAWARGNAENLGLSERVRFVRDDWGRALSDVFDVVFVNPPYVKSADITALAPELAAHEPAMALDGGRDGLDAYRAVASVLLPRLSARGCAYLELGQGQAEAVSEIFTKAGFLVEGTVNDLARIKRCLVMVAAEQHLRQR
jgi:release factor glutamine methyltransferase